MKALKILTATLVATFAVAAQAGPYGPGPGNAGYGPGSGNCAGFGSAPGQGPGGCAGARGADRLKAADTNADGMISRAEAQAALPGLAARFDAIDANKDGNLTLAELQAARGSFARGEGWKKWDANGDGQLSRDEVAAAPRLSQAFDTIDANRDGVLTAEELQAAHRQFAGRGGRGGF